MSLAKQVIPLHGPLRIVAIGGGTGLSSLLRGLKEYVPPTSAFGESTPARLPHIEITAVVTVTDDGGSSGRLRREMDILPPGDIRNCMVALSEDEALLSKLFQYRFEEGRGLKGHSFGNLFLTAMTHLTGDFGKAVKLSSEVLASRGRIYPSTASNVTLEAVLDDGTEVSGETKISRSRTRIKAITLRPKRCKPLAETLLALEQADLICLGPGSLYTSVIPNLLVEGIPAAIRNARARKCYFVNLMWQPGETMSFSASDHVRELFRFAYPGLVDTVIINTRPIIGSRRRRYAAQKVFPVQNDYPHLAELNVRVVGRHLLARGEQIRHSPQAIAAAAVELAQESRASRLGMRGTVIAATGGY
ncbi:MAG: uridine diphosphate-N-acetylglucosamine-binding protein YvcK [Bryobacteraceae bacterium]